MAAIDTLRGDSTVRDVVAATLRDVMPDQTSDTQITDLVDKVMSDPFVKRHDGKRWIELSRSEASTIARVTGQVAARAVLDDT